MKRHIILKNNYNFFWNGMDFVQFHSWKKVFSLNITGLKTYHYNKFHFNLTMARLMVEKEREWVKK
jgi:hypothetical protein